MTAQPSACPVSQGETVRRTLRERIRQRSHAAYHTGILEVAEGILVRDGPRDAKMSEIAQMAGVSVGTLYNYFESKEALVQALVDRNRQLILAQLGAPYRSDNPCQQLREFAARVRDVAVTEAPRLHLLFDWGDQVRCTGSHTAISTASVFANDANWRIEWIDEQLRIEASVRELICHGVTRGELRVDIGVEAMSSVLARLFLASLVEHRPRNDQVTPRDRFDVVVELFLRGAAAQAAPTS